MKMMMMGIVCRNVEYRIMSKKIFSNSMCVGQEQLGVYNILFIGSASKNVYSSIGKLRSADIVLINFFFQTNRKLSRQQCVHTERCCSYCSIALHYFPFSIIINIILTTTGNRDDEYELHHNRTIFSISLLHTCLQPANVYA